jgi:hypothetical protein
MPQSLTTLLGKMLRIHINSQAWTATILPNNPFIGKFSCSGIPPSHFAGGQPD